MLHLNKSKHKASSRKQIAIKEVRDGVLCLPSNEYRLILESSSINFELMSEEEQDVLIDTFQTVLNSLPCKLQILIRVRELSIDQYLDYISQAKSTEREQQYLEQIDDYCHFIKNLVSGNKILSRRFYVVIPYTDPDKNTDFTIIREQLTLLKDIISKNIEKLGMKARELNSLEVLDLFYSYYNPGQAKTQQLKNQAIQSVLRNSYV